MDSLEKGSFSKLVSLRDQLKSYGTLSYEWISVHSLDSKSYADSVRYLLPQTRLVGETRHTGGHVNTL